MTAIEKYFPKRPIDVKFHNMRWRNEFFYIIFGFVYSYGSILALYTSVPNFWDELRLKDAGELSGTYSTSEVRCRRGVKLSWIIVGCEFDVMYITENGGRLSKHLDFDALFLSFDRQKPLQVRYDPNFPEHISTSWGVDMLPYRVLGQVVMQLILIPVAILHLSVSIILPRRMWDIQRAAQNPIPVVVKFLRKSENKNVLMIHYAWIDPVTGRERKNFTGLRKPMEPFWLDAEHKTMLAIASPKGKAYLLDANFEVTNFTPEERRELMQLAPAV